MAAVLSLAAMPASAAELGSQQGRILTPAAVGSPAAWDADAHNAQRHRRHHRRGPSFGDFLAGALVIGTVAAVASAASKPRQPRSYPSRPTNYRGNSRYNSAQAINRAADMCVQEIERDIRVDGIDLVRRSSDGWQVTGSLYNGDGFSCRVGRDGRIDDISYSDRGDLQASNDRQYSDDRYAQAWAETRSESSADSAGPDANPAFASDGGSTPSYPGGLLPGEGGTNDGDGRYSAPNAPEYGG